MKKQGLPSVNRLLIIVFCTVIISTFNYSFADSLDEIKAPITEIDRQGLLESISKNALLPIVQDLGLESNNLASKTAFFCEVKTESSLIDLRSSWLTTAFAWQQLDSLLFGPSVDENIDFAIYFLPIKKAIVKEQLRKKSLSVKELDSAGVGAQGLGALEYLLFSREFTLAEIKQSFNDDPRRCNYLLRVSELLDENIQTISRQWKHYGVQFGLAGNSSLYFFDSIEAMTLLVNKIYQSSQKLSNKKIGLLNNTHKISSSTPYKLDAWRSGSSLMQAQANVLGIKRILEDGGVLNWLKTHKKANLAQELSLAMRAILDQSIPNDDLFIAAQKSSKGVESLVENTQKLTSLIKLELASSLGIALGFNDNDGD